MKRHQTIISSIVVLGLAAAAQTGNARELPDSLKQFAEQQHQQIVVQGWEARRAISKDITVVMGAELKAARIAFIESQGRSIVEQGRQALASIREDLDPARNGGLVAGTLPSRTETADWPQVAAR